MGNAQSKQLMIKVDWKHPLSHRVNDTIDLRWAPPNRNPPPYIPIPFTTTSTFETPFAGYQMYFSYASFSDINYWLHQSLSCMPWRDTEEARTMERTHAECNLVCLGSVLVWCVCACVCVRACEQFKKPLCISLASPSVHVCVCVHASIWVNMSIHVCACTSRVCVPQSRTERDLSARVSSSGWKEKEEAAWLKPVALVMCVLLLLFFLNLSLWGPKTSLSQTSNSPAFTLCKHQRRDSRGRQRKWDRGMRRRRRVFACGGGSRLMLAGILDVICVQL